jgi:hypothetical protein
MRSYWKSLCLSAALVCTCFGTPFAAEKFKWEPYPWPNAQIPSREKPMRREFSEAPVYGDLEDRPKQKSMKPPTKPKVEKVKPQPQKAKPRAKPRPRTQSGVNVEIHIDNSIAPSTPQTHPRVLDFLPFVKHVREHARMPEVKPWHETTWFTLICMVLVFNLTVLALTCLF